MLSRILTILNRKPGCASGHDETASLSRAYTAAAVLFVELARCDGIFNESEHNVIETTLHKQFGLTAAETNALIRLAEKEIDSVWEDCWDNRPFCNNVTDEFSKDERLQIVETLWEVAYADGCVDPFETSLVWRTAANIRVDAPSTETARRAVESRMEQEAA